MVCGGCLIWTGAEIVKVTNYVYILYIHHGLWGCLIWTGAEIVKVTNYVYILYIHHGLWGVFNMNGGRDCEGNQLCIHSLHPPWFLGDV